MTLSEKVLMYGPSHSLNVEIAKSLGWGCVMQDPEANMAWICWKKDYRSGDWIILPNYTGKIADALKLSKDPIRDMRKALDLVEERGWVHFEPCLANMICGVSLNG